MGRLHLYSRFRDTENVIEFVGISFPELLFSATVQFYAGNIGMKVMRRSWREWKEIVQSKEWSNSLDQGS